MRRARRVLTPPTSHDSVAPVGVLPPATMVSSAATLGLPRPQETMLQNPIIAPVSSPSRVFSTIEPPLISAPGNASYSRVLPWSQSNPSDVSTAPPCFASPALVVDVLNPPIPPTTSPPMVKIDCHVFLSAGDNQHFALASPQAGFHGVSGQSNLAIVNGFSFSHVLQQHAPPMAAPAQTEPLAP
ncbi:hypothetical protein Salat_1120000 [Sesamum alatum]|uniref:Uncharacterized protein n=1 Tax=Sesamum alatum TaxID=300844 RepID=A0AAE1YPI1_9LAMI|nr:hypothetical protein Salat_1120000 [Sesamum alatum]